MARKLLCLIFIVLMVRLANSAVFECGWSGDICGFKNGTIITQPYEVITIAGKPANYVNIATTTLFIQEGQFITRYIPVNLFSIFTSLNWLIMSNCGLTNLAANFSVGCFAMRTLYADDGAIQEVPEGFLQTCSNLTSISLKNHKITTIDKDAFRGLTKLENIDMTKNKIICLHPDLFQYTPLLMRVFFTYNKISGLDRNLLRDLKQIAFFDVKYNSITYLPAFNLTAGAVYSMSFYANGNPIYAINPNFCSIFNNRINMIWIKNLPCLPQDTLLYYINNVNCVSSASILQSCYANWTPALPDNVPCAQGSGICIPSTVWSKFAEFFKLLPF